MRGASDFEVRRPSGVGEHGGECRGPALKSSCGKNGTSASFDAWRDRAGRRALREHRLARCTARSQKQCSGDRYHRRQSLHMTRQLNSSLPVANSESTHRERDQQSSPHLHRLELVVVLCVLIWLFATGKLKLTRRMQRLPAALREPLHCFWLRLCNARACARATRRDRRDRATHRTCRGSVFSAGRTRPAALATVLTYSRTGDDSKVARAPHVPCGETQGQPAGSSSSQLRARISASRMSSANDALLGELQPADRWSCTEPRLESVRVFRHFAWC